MLKASIYTLKSCRGITPLVRTPLDTLKLLEILFPSHLLVLIPNYWYGTPLVYLVKTYLSGVSYEFVTEKTLKNTRNMLENHPK